MPESLPAALRPQIEMLLGGAVTSAARLAGGDINDVWRLGTVRGDTLLKASRRRLPNPFSAEAAGLESLRAATPLTVPAVTSHGDAPGGWAYLLLEYLPPAPDTPATQEALGRGLAALHRTPAPGFGGTAPNSFGRLEQVNGAEENAASFFWNQRLAPQMHLADRHLSTADHARFEALRSRLGTLIPPEPPALVHGDLWHGNVLSTVRGPALIDPAAAYSHREVDIALLHLFGSVPERVMAAYQEAYPLTPGWRERLALWNLYPLLAHLNMFGEGYLGRVRAALEAAITRG
ncbi:fructosamine kinase family protein [Deinococcus sp.]|uniref:fructosamine kinase family protein n=1 Tax=Deinococcus sp. TaxID=47478 RepID=UPI002869CFF6|nr:fructosamine kinase family protein [Deinococcus sp.]